MAKLSKQDAERLFEAHRGKPYFNDLTTHAASDLVVAIEVLADNCIGKIRDFVAGARGQFGSDAVRSAVYGSESTAGAAKELELFFSSKSPLQAPAYFTNCSCLVIKPHLIT
jgi:nucleoside-diphosphate kinase